MAQIGQEWSLDAVQAAPSECPDLRSISELSSKSLDLMDLMGCAMAFNQIHQIVAIASLRIARFLLCSIWTEGLDEGSLGTEHAPFQAFR